MKYRKEKKKKKCLIVGTGRKMRHGTSVTRKSKIFTSARFWSSRVTFEKPDCIYDIPIFSKLN